MQFSFSKHDYVTYATSYAFNILLPAALYTSPCLHWSLFYILGRFWVQIFCSKILQNFRSKLGGGSWCVPTRCHDVCPPGVTRTEDVDREDQCWAYPYPLGRWIMMVIWNLSSLPYSSLYFGSVFWVQLLSQTHGPKIPYPSTGNSGVLLGLVKLCSLVMENIRFNKNSVC